MRNSPAFAVGQRASIKQPLQHRFRFPAVFCQQIHADALGHEIDPNVRDLLGFQIRSVRSVAVGERSFCVVLHLGGEDPLNHCARDCGHSLTILLSCSKDQHRVRAFELGELNLETRRSGASSILCLHEAYQLLRGKSRENVKRAAKVRVLFKLWLESQQDVFESDSPTRASGALILIRVNPSG